MTGPRRPVRTLLIDNYDSFTFNLYDLLTTVNGSTPVVVRNDTPWESIDLECFDNIVISPGPGRPDRAADVGIGGRAIASGLPVLGVCLGHQQLCLQFGATVALAPQPVHGRRSDIIHSSADIFANLPTPLAVVRYHSLVVTEVPDELEVLARTPDGLVMAVRHRTRPLWGVQFHPESIRSDGGRILLENFRDRTPLRAGAPVPPAEPTAKVAAASAPWVVEHVSLAVEPDPAALYDMLFGGESRASDPLRNRTFWLDGTAKTDAGPRCTIMGDTSGPRAEFVSYTVASGTVTIERAGLPTEQVRTPFLDYLDAQLRARAVPCVPSIPGDFQLGYVGYLGYELKAETGGSAAHASPDPDAALIFADRAVIIDHETGTCHALCLSARHGDPESARWLRQVAAVVTAVAAAGGPHEIPSGAAIVDHPDDEELRLRHDRAAYRDRIARGIAAMTAGESYEVCLTNEAHLDIDASALDIRRMFGYLRTVSPVPYAALLDFGDTAVVSTSPERFLRVGADRSVESKPIKGTRPRGATPAADDMLRRELTVSDKDLAENLMIVDLVRNDLTRVCVPGTVTVPSLFAVETYASVHQLVSTVRGVLRADMSVVDCVRAAFPAGSMTGAPKIRTMEILDALEDGPRGVYSGAIGYVSLTGTADLSVTIRTLVVTSGGVRFGIGGAITVLSDAEEEFEETLVKAATVRNALVAAATPDQPRPIVDRIPKR